MKSTEKFSDIMKYLDEVEQQEETSVPILEDDLQSLAPSTNESLLAETVVTGMRCKIDSLKKQLTQKDSKIRELEEDLKEAAERETKAHENLRQQSKEDLSRQRQELEGANKRNLKFINALLADKDMLTHRLDTLSVEFKSIEEKHQREIQELQEQHQKKIQHQKGLWATQQKRERQAWTEEQTKKIKQKTLKSLEPDITQLINRHKAEKRRLEEEKNEEIRRKEAIIDQREREIIDVKAKCNRDVEDALIRERQLFHHQLSEQSVRMERQMEEQRRVASRERQQLERCLEEERRRYLKELGDMKAKLDAATDASQALAARFEGEISAEKTKLRMEKVTELETLQDRMREDQQKALAELHTKYKQSLQEEFQQKEADLRAELVKERDNQIASVIQRLEDVSVKHQMQMAEKQKKLQDQIGSLQCKLDTSAAEKERLQESVETANEAEAELQKKFAKLQKDFQAAKEKHQKELHEKDDEVDLICKKKDDEWAAKYSHTTHGHTEVVQQQADLVWTLQQQLDTAKKAHQKELEEMKENQNFELEEVNIRVKEALSKKDTTLKELREMVARLEQRNKQVEDVLRHQNELLASGAVLSASQ
eukprot:TRINITY_DN35694_c0_g1_i1.p1 TRINITY_DN35694_c0_g1~~TRINITY_DN35694_c0_g1_i1.p1  ORF type:complete len:615 (-),score=104.97 TRINITY_DN35694_c0_g1_i1:343-2133(-)